MIRKLFVALFAFAPAALSAQPAPPGDPFANLPADTIWVNSEAFYASVPARTLFPRTAGTMSAAGTRDLRPGTGGIDSTLQYRSADGAIIGTVYVYYPGLAHSGLAAYATDRGIRANSRTPVEGTPMRVVDAGGIGGAAIRTDYRNYMDGNASTAAFIKAGRWLIKLRVTGPEARRAEVMAAMDALLAGIRVGPANPARPAAPVTVTDCPPGTGQRDATLLPDPPQAELGAYGFLALFDGAGMEATNETSGARELLPSRVPSALCVSGRIGDAGIPILRAADGEARSPDGRTRAVVPVTDAGTMLEVVDAPALGRHVLLYHQIGSTNVLGSFDAVPSDRQIAALFSERDNAAARVRVPVTLKPDGGTEMGLPALEAPRPFGT